MNPGSRISPLRFPARLFPQTAPIVVSRIFRVTGSLKHKPACNDLQNKQENGGGVSAVSPMLKLDSLPPEKLEPCVFNLKSLTLFGVMTFFYQKGGGSAFRGKWMISSKSKGEGGTYLARGDQFFLLNSCVF